MKHIETLGTSSDLYAGQAVDRVGVKLGFGFPAGVEVSRLAAECDVTIKPKSSVRGMECSLSGLENQCNALLTAGKALPMSVSTACSACRYRGQDDQSGSEGISRACCGLCRRRDEQ